MTPTKSRLTWRSARGSQSESWTTTALMLGRSVPSPHEPAACRNALHMKHRTLLHCAYNNASTQNE